ncbi:LAME_0H08174g1_1 [Lachancea meyersii CBS 8951]|uniref:LAME_0H08174g1_1 n=1 Tax=Lachancea meyersii CBS 8951 TaxID=1266667 RepID=A0A1G4KF23_9SACH|nr:LAME_0H08174g1_1 [Lachancea meyersii CBS 8951]
MLEPLLFFGKLAFRLPYAFGKSWISGKHHEFGILKWITVVFLMESANSLDHLTMKYVVNPALAVINRIGFWWLGAAQRQGLLRWIFREPNAPVLMYVHGGGMCLDMLPYSLAYLRHLKKEVGNLSLAYVDYSLCERYPKAVDEVWNEYQKLVSQGHQVWLLGDSAGGNLCLNVLQKCVAEKTVLPEKCLTVSPWLNVTKTESYVPRSESIDFLTWNQLAMFKNVYAPNGDYTDPYLNLETNFEPDIWTKVLESTKLLIVCGEDEILYPEISRFAQKLRKIDASGIKLVSQPRGVHCGTMMFDLGAPQDERPCLQEAVNFLRQ